jgi:hypothetical protein
MSAFLACLHRAVHDGPVNGKERPAPSNHGRIVGLGHSA